MSAFKGTPGPWAWGHNTASSDVTHCIDVTAKDGIGSVAYLQSYTADDYDDLAETIANARLIAAAPELLGQHEADMVDLDLLAKAIHAGDPMPELVIRVTDMLNRKRAAIAKATGEQP